ncbi:hypothetical protein QFZ74_006094 [Streptomyces sp. V3I7]|nr:hypothetical protein [Streptomyces sp. V3I7]
MSAYLSMLWAFEHVEIGRELLLKDSDNKPDDAVKHLDRMITGHVCEYICTFHAIRGKLRESKPDAPVFDGAYTKAFENLRHALYETADEATRVKLESHANDSSCRCVCHNVPAAPPDPPLFGTAT